jgi:hypothetical protein
MQVAPASPIASTLHGAGASPIASTGHAANPSIRAPTASPALTAQAPVTAVYGSAAPPVRMPTASTSEASRGGWGLDGCAGGAGRSPVLSTPPVSTHGASGQAVPAPVSSFHAASVHAAVHVGPGRAPVPAIPSFNAAPLGAPRPSTPSQPPSCDPARSAIVQREFEQRASASARTASATVPDQTSRMLAVVLVVLAAAAAAISVYFVLPLLT